MVEARAGAHDRGMKRISPVVLAAAVLAMPEAARAEDHAMNDPVLFGSGVALSIVGAMTGTAGLVVYGVGQIQFCFGSQCSGDDTLRDTGIAMLVGGIAATLIGLPMIAVGASHGPTAVSVVPTFSPHGGGLGVVARF